MHQVWRKCSDYISMPFNFMAITSWKNRIIHESNMAEMFWFPCHYSNPNWVRNSWSSFSLSRRFLCCMHNSIAWPVVIRVSRIKSRWSFYGYQYNARLILMWIIILTMPEQIDIYPLWQHYLLLDYWIISWKSIFLLVFSVLLDLRAMEID